MVGVVGHKSQGGGRYGGQGGAAREACGERRRDEIEEGE